MKGEAGCAAGTGGNLAGGPGIIVQLANGGWYQQGMSKPVAKPILPEEVESLALAVIHADRFPHLATVDDGHPRVRPVSPVRTDGFTVYVANLRMYHKTIEIAANPRVELCYLDDNHDQVRLSRLAEIVTERPLLQEIWDASPLMGQYLGSLDNPALIIYRIRPTRVRFMREWALDYHEVPLGGATLGGGA